jgi:SH3 domain protein
MAKKLKFKPTPAGIMFLSAIGVLLIAIIIITIVLAKNCNKTRSNDTPETDLPVTSVEPSLEASTQPLLTPDPAGTTDPVATTDPNATPDPDASASPSDTSGPGPIVITTPGTSGTATLAPGTTATASPSPSYYTSPTSTMKKNAQKGYVNADGVRMRKGPGTKFDIVKDKIAKNTAVTLYTEQEGWWFLKCGDSFGYILGKYVSKGSAPTSATSEATGKVIASKIALRKSASSSSECIKEYTTGEQLTIYWYEKNSSGGKWYYVKTSDGKKGYMYAEYVKVTSGKVSEK